LSVSIDTTQYDAILAAVVEILREMTSDWDLELSGEIAPGSCLVADLGFESLDVVMLIVELEERFDRTDLPFGDLLLVDGALIADLSVADLSLFLSRHVSLEGSS
jgi:acyl carrier protein